MFLYKIEKISIDKEQGQILVSRLAAVVREFDNSLLDKRTQEVYVTSADEKIDIWMKIQFNSDYRIVSGGVECTDRSVNCKIEMTIPETGEQIEYKSELLLDEEIEKIFKI